jgi:hypothetical protein
MLKTTLAAAFLGLAFMAPAFAQDMKCDEATMTKMQADMAAMTDPAMKDKVAAASKEMEMAMAAMKDNKADECMTHMKGAMDAVK